MTTTPVIVPEEEKFLREHRFAVISTLCRNGAPQSTPVYYFYEDGKLYISATRDRFKTINAQRDPRVSVCALDEDPPFSYVQVMGRVEITDDDLVAKTRRIYMLFRTELADDFEEGLRREGRILMVVTPERVTSRARRSSGAR